MNSILETRVLSMQRSSSDVREGMLNYIAYQVARILSLEREIE